MADRWTGHAEQDRQEQDRQKWTGRTGKAGKERQNRTGRTGQAKPDRQNRDARTVGKPGQDQPGENSQEGIEKRGKQ
jgi:hypothetical protein